MEILHQIYSESGTMVDVSESGISVFSQGNTKDELNSDTVKLFDNAFKHECPTGDGQPLCSVAHPTANGTIAHTFYNGVGFNTESLEDAVNQLSRNSNSNSQSHKMKLMVSSELWPVALRIFQDIGIKSVIRGGYINVNLANPGY